MKRLFLIALLLSVPALAGHAHYSFTIDNDSSSALIQAGWISQLSPTSVYGRVPDIDINYSWFGPITPVKYQSQVLLRFKTLIDSLREYLSGSGTWSIDSAEISLAIYMHEHDETDSCKYGIALLRPGVGAASRHFQRGNGILGTDSGGVSWNACVATEGNPNVDSLPWTTAGAKGVNDTIGGTVYETRWYTVADTMGMRVTWQLSGADIAAMFDSTSEAALAGQRDTTDARHAGLLLFVSQYRTNDSTHLAGVGCTVCSGYHGGAFGDQVYCNWSGCEPSLTVWMTNEWTGLRSIGRTGAATLTVGRPAGAGKTLQVGR